MAKLELEWSYTFYESMSLILQSITSLFQGQKGDVAGFKANLVLERLYYADGRHHPNHPQHGSFLGLNQLGEL